MKKIPHYIDLVFDDPRDNFRMFYREFGNPDKPTLLLLHGGGIHGESNWQPFIELDDAVLTEQFHVISPDHRGHGRTNNPRGTFKTYRDLADDMAVFIRQAGLNKPIIMGHSSGAVTSLHLSIFHPDRLSKQILIGMHPNLGRSETFKQGLQTVYGTKDYRIPPTKWQMIKNDLELVLWSWWIHREVNWHELIRSAWPMWATEFDLKRCDEESDCDYSRVKCPTLIVWGEDEDFGSHEDHQLLADWIPGSQGILVKRDPPERPVPHIFVSEQPEKLKKAIWPFLTESCLVAN